MLYNELIFFSTYYKTWELTDEEGRDNAKKKRPGKITKDISRDLGILK